MPADTDRAWAAGFFDGEGCFSLNRTRAVVTISQNDREVLDRFHRIVGCGAVYGPHKGNPRTKQQPFFSWRASAREDFDHIVQLLWPWLGTVKRAAATRVGDAAGPGGNPQSRKTHCPQGHPYDEENTRWVRPHRNAKERTNRQCRICTRERQRANTRRAKEA